MKNFIIILSLLFITTSFKADTINTEKVNKSLVMPCNYLYVDNQSTNSDEVIQIKFTEVNTGEVRTFGTIGMGNELLDCCFCGTYNIEVIVSVGGFNSAVGLRANLLNGGSTIISCQDYICCADGIKLYFNDVTFINYAAANFDIFLKNGYCN